MKVEKTDPLIRVKLHYLEPVVGGEKVCFHTSRRRKRAPTAAHRRQRAGAKTAPTQGSMEGHRISRARVPLREPF